MSTNVKQRRLLASLLCLFVALLAVHLKMCVYPQHNGSTHATLVKVKMWEDGQKAQLGSDFRFSTYPVSLVFIAFLVFGLPAITTRRTSDPASSAPISLWFHAFQFDRFLRPPPVLA